MVAELPSNTILLKYPNGGVPQAINTVVKTWPAPWWIVCNNDSWFMPGDLKILAECAWQHHEQVPAVFPNIGLSCGALTKLGIQKVGLFDENFYPVYIDDKDWFYRCKLAGLPIVQTTQTKMQHVHSVMYQNLPKLAEAKNVSYYFCCDYYRNKWGGDWEHETYLTPFNLPNCPIDYWHYDPERRERMQWKVA